MVALGIAAAVMAVYLGMLLNKNAEISAQNRDLQRQLSSILVDTGQRQLEGYDVKGALGSALEAMLPGEDEDLYDHRVEALLNSALGSYQRELCQSVLLWEQSTDIADIVVTEDGKAALVADKLGTVRCLSLPDGKVLWLRSTLASMKDVSMNNTELRLLPGELLLCKNFSSVSVLSLSDGEVVWRYEYLSRASVFSGVSRGNRFFALSPDGALLTLIDSAEEDATPSLLKLFDTASGAELGSLELCRDEQSLSLEYEHPRDHIGAAFSESGDKLALGYYVLTDRTEGYLPVMDFCCSVIDTRSMSLLQRRTWENGTTVDSFRFYGLAFDEKSGDVFCAQYHPQYGAIVNSVFHWQDKDEDRTFTDHSPRAEGGASFSGSGEFRALPLLASEYNTLVCSDNTLYVFDTKSGALRKSYSFLGSILYAAWADRDEEIVELLTDDGIYAEYDLAHGGDAMFDAYFSGSYDQSGLTLAVPVRGGLHRNPESGMFLTVRGEKPGQLLAVRNVSDAGIRTLEKPAEASNSRTQLLVTPSGERVLGFFPYSGLTVIAYDAADGEKLEEVRFEGLFLGDECALLDETHFLYDGRICCMDGTVTWPDECSEDERSEILSVRLEDGRLLSARNAASEWSPALNLCWLDGKLVPASAQWDRNLAFQSTSLFELSPNGWYLGYGVCGLENEEGKRVLYEQPRFAAFNALDGERSLIEDRSPGSVRRIVAMYGTQPCFICGYDSGELWLYRLDDGSASRMEIGYSSGEIAALSLSPDDSFLLVLTAFGRLDIYDPSDGARLYSETPAELANDLVGINSLRCRADKEKGRLHVFISRSYESYSCWLCIDTEAWLASAEASYVYDWTERDDTLYLMRGGELCRVKVHSLQELAERAREEIS